MLLLAGCHLFSSGVINMTCEDQATCGDDTGQPVDTGNPLPEQARSFAALVCPHGCDKPDDDGFYILDAWVSPTEDPWTFRSLASTSAWNDVKIAFSEPSQGADVFVIQGNNVVHLGHGGEVDVRKPLMEVEITTPVSVAGKLVFMADGVVQQWDPADDALDTVDFKGKLPTFTHGFPLASKQIRFLAFEAGKMTSWTLSLTTSRLEQDPDAPPIELGALSAGVFAGPDDSTVGCNGSGVITDAAGQTYRDTGFSGSVVGCGYDDLLGFYLLEATQGLMVWDDGLQTFVTRGGPPGGGTLISGVAWPG